MERENPTPMVAKGKPSSEAKINGGTRSQEHPTGREKATVTRSDRTYGKKTDTLLVTSGEDDAAGLVPDEALGDPSVAELRGNWVRFEHLDGQSVAVGAGFELVHLGEHGLPQARLRRAGRWILRIFG